MMDGELKKATGPVQLKKSGCPVGTYSAVFVGAYDLPPRTDGGSNYGPAVLLKWRADNGLEPSAIVSAQPTAKNATGHLLRGMLSRDLRPDEALEWGQFEGARHTVLVGLNKSGTGTTVKEVLCT